MASFNKSNFQVSYKLVGEGDYDTSIYKWAMTEPFPLSGYGPMGGAFNAEVVQRKNGRYEPWVFVPKVIMIHRVAADPFQAYNPDAETEPAQFGLGQHGEFPEPSETLGRYDSFDGALRGIMDYVRQKIGQRAWVGHETEDWWL